VAQGLALRMMNIGFVECSPYVYKLGMQNCEVDRYLYFIARPDRGLLTADFGFRQAGAEQLSLTMFAQVAGPAFPLQVMMKPNKCSMRFSFWRFLSMEGPCCWEFNDRSDWAGKSVSDIETILVPFFKTLSTREQLFARLVSDDEPCPWFASNSAIRIVQIIYLGGRLRMPRSSIESVIVNNRHSIEHDLEGKSVTAFIESAFAHANVN
jgi:hypothetical protein